MTSGHLRGALAAASVVVIAGSSALHSETAADGVLLLTQSLSTSDILSTAEFLGPEGMLDAVPLYLSVTVNGHATGVVAEFTLHRDGRRLASTRDELNAVGLIAPRGLSGEVFLDDIPGVSFAYDPDAQSLDITAPVQSLKPQVISDRPVRDLPLVQHGYGAVLNYRLSVDLGRDILTDGPSLHAGYADLEGRIYAPFGVFTTKGAITATGPDFADPQFTRYESNFTYSNPKRMLNFTLGDFVSSSLPWGRSVRLGGVQLRRDFSLRDDIITNPRLSYAGIAAVPSTVDVYVNNVRAWSGKTDAGPFKLTDLPMIGSAGEAVIVIRDPAGNEQVGHVPFFAGRDVLKAGSLQFSLDAGRPRGAFTSDQEAYGPRTVGVTSLRFGVTDRITLLGQAEGGMGLSALTLGVTAILLNAAEVTLAAGRSSYDAQDGRVLYGTLRSTVADVDLELSSLRSSEDYTDLATVLGLARLDGSATAEDISRQYPARAQDALTLGFNDLLHNGSLNLNFIHAERADATNSIVAMSYSRPVGKSGSMRLAGFTDLQEGGFGASIGFDFSLGERGSTGVGLSRGADGRMASYAGLSRPIRRELGSTGYRAAIYGWHDGRPHGDWTGSYRGGLGQAGLRLSINEAGKMSGSASFDGAVVAAGGRVLAGNRIRDGFAVVKLGVPGVPVLLRGREVAKTGPFGAALVPDLRAYRSNRVSIDPTDLPADVNLSATAMSVVPAALSGVTVTFGEAPGKAALVVLRGTDGSFLPAGTPVELRGRSEDFFVGYDGEVWLEGLSEQNRVTATLDNGTCSASFAFALAANKTARIEGVTCE